MLKYKTLYGDILVFKNANDCMTITAGNLNKPYVTSIEIDGENLDDEECEDYDLINHPLSTFSQDEADYFIDNYYLIINNIM